MKNVCNNAIILLILFFCSFNNLFAQEMTREQAFFYFMKVYEKNPNTKTYDANSMEGNACGTDFLTYFANVFDSYNYKLKRNDEFERNNYLEKLNSRILTGINNAKFDIKYTKSCPAEFGEYSFSNRSFPIRFDPKTRMPFFEGKNCFLESYCEILNSSYLSWNLTMSETQAKNFTAKRKDPNGRINREIYLKFTYSVVNKKTTSHNSMTNLLGRDIVIYVYSIDIFDYNGSTQKIATLYPTIDFDDKVQGSRGGNGQETIYYNSQGKIVKSESEANSYKIVNYSNGEIVCPVKTYYISQKLNCEGCYKDLVEDGHGYGLFTWYYESGQKWAETNYLNGKIEGLYIEYFPDGKKSQESNYSNGLYNGKFLSWHNNGALKEEVNYINGYKDGCDYFWNENGKCITGSSLNYVPYYKNGNSVLYSRACPCKSPPQILNPSNSTVNENVQTIKDREGNNYKIVTIGNQVWMAENLKSKQYLNGDPIPNVTDNVEWSTLSSGAYCYYNNDISIANSYGNLYNYFSVRDNRGLCPSGWHIPSIDEWKKLMNYLGGETSANMKLKEVGTSHWDRNINASNTSGFTGLPGGYRDGRGSFRDLGFTGFFWSTSSYNSAQSWNYHLASGNPNFTIYQYGNEYANSIRCVCDLDARTFFYQKK